MECFKVYANEIEGRLDCEFYKKRLKISKEVNKFETKILGDISVLKRGPFGGSIKKEIFVEKEENTYQVYEQYNAINNDPYRARYFISEKDYKRLESFAVMPNDIIMSCSGTIGKLAVIPNDFNKGVINQALLRIRLKSGFNINYFVIIFSLIIEKLIEGNEFAYGAAIRNIVSIDELKNIQIPLPPLEIQNKIVQLMDNAYSLKKLKEAEAQKLLDSISDYVLDELGIKLPELKDKMTYVVNSEEVQNGRLDPYYHQPKFEEVEKAIEKGKYGIVKIREIVDESANKTVRIENNEKYIYIEIGDINKSDGTIILKAEEFGEKLPTGSKNKLIENDVIISTVRPYLKGIAKVKNCEKNLVSTGAFCVLRCTKKINPDYLLGFVRSNLFINMVCRNMSGTTYPTVSDEDILDLETPLPPLEIQNKIAEEVKTKMEKSKQLQEEAKSILEGAKEKVERIILGGDE
jgi:restriction endonuclease S subunit